MKDKISFGAKQKRIWGFLLALVWMSLGLLFYKDTVESQPESW